MMMAIETLLLLVPSCILVAQVLVLARLAMAIRGAVHPLPGGLAMHFGIWLVVAPGLEFLVYGAVVGDLATVSHDPVLRFVQEYGGFAVATAWVLLSVPMCRLLARPGRLLRGRGALAVPATMALLTAVLSASHLAAVATKLSGKGGLRVAFGSGWLTGAVLVGFNVLLFAVTALPLLGMVMVIVHSARGRADARRSTNEENG